MSEYKRLTTKCEVGINLTETSGNIVNDYEKVVNRHMVRKRPEASAENRGLDSSRVCDYRRVKGRWDT